MNARVKRFRGGTRRPAIESRVMVYMLGVALLIAASLAAIANQSGKLVGVHEIPPFVCDRVELVPSLTVDRSADEVSANRSERVTPDDLPVPGSRGSICAHNAGVGLRSGG